MEIALWCVALAIATLPAIPVLVFAVECLSGSLPRKVAPKRAEGLRPSVAVLVPAHDEESGIANTINSIRRQMLAGDRLLVVADNCTDDTAAVARSCGAEVPERSDALKRGKGFALDFGLTHLAHNPRPVVVFVDADCTLTPGTLDELARAVVSTGRPVQSCNLMTALAESRNRHGTAEFAFRVKNLVRPRGLARFGLPCLLTGTGMALPWALARGVRLGHGHLVEDMMLGLDLAASGHAPIYCETAGVRSLFPETAAGQASQRSRWETGHLAMIATILSSGTLSRISANPACLALMLDILVPPLTLLAAMQGAAVVVGGIATFFGLGWAPLATALAGTSLLMLGCGAAWLACGRDVVPATAIWKIPGYMLAKAWIYPRALLGQMDRAWIRTDRTNA